MDRLRLNAKALRLIRIYPVVRPPTEVEERR